VRHAGCLHAGCHEVGGNRHCPTQPRETCPKAQHVSESAACEVKILQRPQAASCVVQHPYGMYMFKWLLQGALMTAVIVVSL